MQKPTKKTVSINSIISRDDINIREANNYDLPAMEERIVRVGKILKPLFVEQTDEGLIALAGNRRTRAGQNLLKNNQRIVEILQAIADTAATGDERASLKKAIVENTAAVVDNLGKVEVWIYSNLTESERLTLIMDHSDEKPISRTEVVNCCWRMDRKFLSEGEIISVMYYSLAKFTGNERKLAEVPSETKAREAFLRKWLHGTVGNYILAAHKMGDYVREQFLLTMRADDSLLTDGEKVEMRCSRDRITQLSAAKTKDKDVWTPSGGGPEFNKLIEQFKGEDAGTTESDKKKRPTVKELNDKADVFKSGAIRKALLIAAGETGEKVNGLLEDDDRIYRDEQALKVLSTHWDKLPKAAAVGFDVQAFARAVLDFTPAKLTEYLNSVVQQG